MTDLSTILNTAVIAASTQAITGDTGSSLTAAGYSAWITSITGKPPAVQRVGTENRAVLMLDEEQVLSLRAWLSSQVGGMLAPGAPELLDVGLAPAIGPWALQYAAPLILGALVVGWMGHWFTTRK